MDSLPDLNFAGHPEPLTASEQALLDKSKRDFKEQLTEALSQLKHSISTIATTPTKTVDPALKSAIETLSKLLNQHLTAALSTNRTKRELDSLQDVISSAEKLAFLVRYFNWENDENYVKFLSAQAPKVHSIIYAFNVFVQNLIKSIIQHIEVDPQVLLRFLKHLQEQETSAVPSEMLGLRTPIKRKRTANELSRVILLDYYYLERSYRSLQDLLINGAVGQTQKKIRAALQPEGGSDIFGDELDNQIGNKGSENKVLIELQKELERINQLKGDEEILNYLYKTKGRLDQTLSQAETSIQTLEKEALTQVTEALSKGELDDDSPKKSYTPLVLDKVDEILSTEVKGYSIGGKTLKAYWQEISERIRQEVSSMISMEKFLLQASYLSIYFEEKFVVFHEGRGQFAQENFAKLIEDFSNNANKEYKYMPQLNNSQGLHPLYYCYVAENFQDFYLVEYNPANPVLKVYITAAPMLATLHKHLAKLDITKIAKKSFSITRLNYFDTDVGVELRNLFLDPKNQKRNAEDSDEEEEEDVPKHFRYFVFITIFLLHNSPVQANAPEIIFGVQDLINFYNYLAEFQSVTLKHQEENQPIPPTFEFYYPFVNGRQSKEHYLVFNKKDPSRDIGMTSVRNICYQNKDFLQYGELLSEEKFYNESFFNNEVLKYLKRNETKPSFNFDGHPYLIEYLKRIPQTTQGQASDNAMTVYSRLQTQSMLDVFLAGDRNIETVRGLEDSSKSAKVYLMFSGAPECLGLLMIAYERVKNRCTVYLWGSKDSQDQEVLNEFVDHVKGSIGGAKGEGTTKYVICRSHDEVVINYFRTHYFPYTYFFEQEALGTRGSLEINLEDLVEPFKSFLSINISENNLDVFKVYSRILEDKMFKHWEIVNIGVMWKFSELKYTLQTLAEKLMEEQVDHVLLSFTYIGALGSKVYYLYLQEMAPEESKEESKMDTQSQEVTYMIDVYSLAYNLDLDDREILTIIYYCCKVISKPRLVFNAAYRINPRNNILLYTQVEITLTTLGYLVHFGNLSMERAFQKISRSIVGHYEILESIMSQSGALNQAEGAEQPEKIESNDLKEPTLAVQGVEGSEKQKINLKIYQSFFEDILKEVQYKKKLELEVPALLKQVDLETDEESEGMDIASFLNILNCEIISPLTYFFATNEMFTKRVITNENNILTDKSVYSFLIKELASARVKYEEALEIRYQSTTIYFICPLNLLHVHKVPLVKYNIESHHITYYYLNTSAEPELNDNIAAFIDTLSLKLASNNPQSIKALSSKELKITPCPVSISEDLQEIVEQQYQVIIKALIRFSSRQDTSKEKILTLNTEKLNAFMCEYAEDLLQSVETSKIKSNYRYLSNMFLQKDSPITKKIALLTFLNGTASIEQLTIIKDCIKTFREDFNKIEGIEHAFFCFNVSVKNSLKHYLLHLSGQSGQPLKLKVFTNVLGDTDSVIDRMIQGYCLEEGGESSEGPIEQTVGELLIFKINIPNTIFTRYLEISSFLIAHAVCNDVDDSNEYCAQLALSPIHYLNELTKFENKCEVLNLFKEPSSGGRV